LQVAITNIKPNPKNPRVIKDEKFKKLVKSLTDFPEMLDKRPLVCYTDVDGKLVVLGGNMRLKAAKEIGLKELPVLLADDWNAEQRAEFLIKDNVGFGEWDWAELQTDFDTVQLEDWGLDLPVDLVIEAGAVEDDFSVPEGGIETDIVQGDLFEIGEHRLLCGDSTDSDAVARLMNGSKADMVFTDPPYGVKMSRSLVSGKDNSILNDDLTKEDLSKLINDAFVNSVLFSKDCHFYWWVGFRAYSIMENIFINNDVKIDNCIVWNKPSIGLGKIGYRYKHELCLFKGEIKDKSLSDVWDFGRDREGLHPTMKPIELISYAMNNSSKIDNLVLDLFLGSGSTMVASHQLNRKCYGMELDPKYCQVIIDRMRKLDPALIIKKNGELI